MTLSSRVIVSHSTHPFASSYNHPHDDDDDDDDDEIDDNDDDKNVAEALSATQHSHPLGQ